MMAAEFVTLFAVLVFGHALGDYPLQNDFMAHGKNWNTPVAGVPWYHLLAAHSVIHGGLAGLATGSVVIGILETIMHFAIDSLKNRGITSIHSDQALHIACKIVWALLVVANVV